MHLHSLSPIITIIIHHDELLTYQKNIFRTQQPECLTDVTILALRQAHMRGLSGPVVPKLVARHLVGERVHLNLCCLPNSQFAGGLTKPCSSFRHTTNSLIVCRLHGWLSSSACSSTLPQNLICSLRDWLAGNTSNHHPHHPQRHHSQIQNH